MRALAVLCAAEAATDARLLATFGADAPDTTALDALGAAGEAAWKAEAGTASHTNYRHGVSDISFHHYRPFPAVGMTLAGGW